MIKKYDFEFNQGDDFALKLAVVDTAASPVNLDGYKFFVTFKRDIKEPDSLAPVKVDSEVLVNGSNEVYLALPNNQTNKLKIGIYLYDIQMKTPTGAIKTVHLGRALINPQITQRAS